MVTGCEYLTERRTSTQRSASDAEVDDIIHLFDVLDSCDSLKELQFAALSYDRLPKYGPEEINVCTVVDKQIHTDSKLIELCAKVDSLSADPGSLATISSTISDSDINKISNSFGNQLQASTRTIQDQLTQLTAVCNQLSGLSQSSSSVGHQLKDRQLDRSRNIVVTGVAEDRNDKVWRSNVVAVLQVAAGRDVQILDAFRLGGRFTAGKTRPILVKLQSAWDRRVVLSGASSLARSDVFRQVYIAPDESLDTRRRNTLDRLKGRAERAGLSAVLSSGVLSIDGNDVFSLEQGYLVSRDNVFMLFSHG